jgi:hypothetical protein
LGFERTKRFPDDRTLQKSEAKEGAVFLENMYTYMCTLISSKLKKELLRGFMNF